MPGKQSELKVRDVIARDLTQEPNTVVKVDELALLRTDIAEYVLDESLAKGFADIFEPLVEANKPAAKGGGKVGVWVSGFFGTGKSHFAKLAGHLIADTPIDGTTSARDAFRALLHDERDRDHQLAKLLHEADAGNIRGQLVAFDIATQQSGVGEQAAYLAFLSAFYESIGFSDIPAFAEAELEMLERGVYDAFLARFEEVVGQPWADANHLSLVSSRLAEVLADVRPEMYSSAAAAESALDKSLEDLGALNTKKVVDRIIQWLKIQESLDGPKMVVFVADEVGAWAGHDLQRIEQVRALSETIESEGRGKIWMIVTSQERLSAVVQNTSFASTSEADNFQQRLEARFGINIHLASQHAGMVVEERILRKKTDKRPLLAELWSSHAGQLADLAEPPGLQMGHEYPRAEEDHFIQSYPFLPYELPAAGDIFGPMRSVKVSGGARSMIGVAFDALRELADKELGALVAWDTIFDAANRDNEFADEHYLGGQGLTYIKSADKDLKDAPVGPSRLLKTLWLIQQSPSVARNPKNLARLLADNLDSDLLLL